MHALVTGSTGFVGSHLLDALIARGDQVTSVVRAPGRLRHRDAPNHLVRRAALDDVPALRGLVADADVVFHVAGIIAANDPLEYRRVNAIGTRAVALACRDALPRPKRLVLVSSLAASGPAQRGAARRENDPPAPVSAYGESKVAAEREALAVAGALEVTIVRPCVVYGPRDTAVLPLFRAVNRRVAARLPTNPELSLIHVRDLVDCLLRAAESPNAPGRTYFAAGPRIDLDDAVTLIGRALDRRPLQVPVPAPVLLAAGTAADAVAWLTRRSHPFGRQKAREMLVASWVCSPERAARELGFEARVPHADGLAETAAWYRAEGWL